MGSLKPPLVGFHMAAQVELSVELSRALWTAVPFDSNMDFRVLEKIRFLSETVSASRILTFIGLLVRVDS